MANGTLSVKKVLLEDKGKYGCTANNSGGVVRVEAYLDVASMSYFKRLLFEINFCLSLSKFQQALEAPCNMLLETAFLTLEISPFLICER